MSQLLRHRSVRKSPRITLAFILAAFIGVSLSTTAILAQEHDDARWISTWITSPSTLHGAGDAEAALHDQTLRLIVHSSVGGSALRLRLSNYHGDETLSIGEVAVALQTEGSNIDAGSSTTVTFAGSDSISIAKGATVISDAIEFSVPELSNLAVSIYLPGDSGFLTAHALSNQTNYLSEPGNHVADASLVVRAETPAWPLLTAIDVIGSTGITAIATVGDSITDGWGSTDSANQRWPNHFARRLFAEPDMNKFAILNAGISGNQVTGEDNPLFGQNLQARFERDVLALENISHMVLMEGINDIGMPILTGGSSTPAATIIAGYQQIIRRAHLRGIKVIAATLTPFEGAVYYTVEGEAIRQEVNSFIRDSGNFDGVIDFDSVVQDPSQPSRILPDLTADNLHPNDEGYEIMANAIDLNLFR